MKNRKVNVARVWKELEDFVVPRLALSVVDRAVYSHLLRHSHLEGKPRLRFSIAWLARGARLSNTPTRQAVRRLVDQGALALIERSKFGHTVEVRLPNQIRAACSTLISPRGARPGTAAHLEKLDFFHDRRLCDAIHSRERQQCFYCMRRLTTTIRCLDHVVPQVHLGGNSYRNLVSCCLECNSQKRQLPASDFLRNLYRERRITAAELTARLAALDQLAAGRLRPIVDTHSNPLPRRGRPRLSPR
jgi:hypothetical protein